MSERHELSESRGYYTMPQAKPYRITLGEAIEDDEDDKPVCF